MKRGNENKNYVTHLLINSVFKEWRVH
jgi:hypothetical protein